MTYFRMGNPHYHWRDAVSRSCSGWEGVGPACYGRQEFGWRVRLEQLLASCTRVLEEVSFGGVYRRSPVVAGERHHVFVLELDRYKPGTGSNLGEHEGRSSLVSCLPT